MAEGPMVDEEYVVAEVDSLVAEIELPRKSSGVSAVELSIPWHNAEQQAVASLVVEMCGGFTKLLGDASELKRVSSVFREIATGSGDSVLTVSGVSAPVEEFVVVVSVFMTVYEYFNGDATAD